MALTMRASEDRFARRSPPHDMTGQCIECHTFAGRERIPHNTLIPGRTDLFQPSACAIPNIAASASLTSMNEMQCHHCHRTKFESFTDGIPLFE
jgi:hypothetical protein